MQNESDIALKTVNITKRFPETVANQGINFTLKKGEIHVLLGENGAGKTTFMNILYGIYMPTEGEIYINGRKVEIRTPMDAMRLGIGMIHQHFMLVEPLTVLENVVLGMKGLNIWKNRRSVSDRIIEISKTYGLNIEPDKKIWQLSVGQQQKVEIVKVLFRGANILILDEPTAVLRPQETGPLFEILRRMKRSGKSIIFITHKLDEVMAVADRISILRRGKLIATVNREDVTKRELAEMMVGRPVLFEFEKPGKKHTESLLTINDLEVYSETKGLKVVDNVTLNVYRGEILGIAGISGNGQQELVQAVAGLLKVTKGRIIFKEKDITNKHPRYITRIGINYIPADRIGMGLAPDLSCVENAIMRNYYKKPISRGVLIDYDMAEKHTKRIVDTFSIAVADIKKPVKLLSGGNMQKLLFGREMFENPELLIASYPTRGLDIASTEFVRKQMLKLREKGTSVILISEDLDELLSISDRIAVMYQGRVIGVADASLLDKNAIGLMMAGTPLKEALQ